MFQALTNQSALKERIYRRRVERKGGKGKRRTTRGKVEQGVRRRERIRELRKRGRKGRDEGWMGWMDGEELTIIVVIPMSFTGLVSTSPTVTIW